MLSILAIAKLFKDQQWDRLARSVCSSGLALPLPLAARLAQAPAGTVGLALARVLELTYGQTALSRDMVDFLLHSQNEDGSFADDPAVTAAAAAALGAALRDRAGDYGNELATAHQRAIGALMSMQGDDGLFHGAQDRDTQSRRLVTAFVLMLLAGDAMFAAHLRMADLLTHFEQHCRTLDEHTARFWQMAEATLHRHETVHESPRKVHVTAA